MVSFSSLALLSLATVGALAAPSVQKRGWWWEHPQCMTDAEAQQVANNYAQLIRQYSQTLADAALAVDFVDYSESVNSLINTCPQGSAAITLPLLSATFSSRAQFEAGQGQQAPINFNQLNIEHNCCTVTIRWETTNTAPVTPTLPVPRPVVGIILIEAEKAPKGSTYPWLVKTVYSEFDAAAWLQNLEQAGGICASANPSSPPVSLASGTIPTPTATVTASPVATSTGAAPVSYSPSVPVSAPASSPSSSVPVDTCTDTSSSVIAPTTLSTYVAPSATPSSSAVAAPSASAYAA